MQQKSIAFENWRDIIKTYKATIMLQRKEVI